MPLRMTTAFASRQHDMHAVHGPASSLMDMDLDVDMDAPMGIDSLMDMDMDAVYNADADTSASLHGSSTRSRSKHAKDTSQSTAWQPLVPSRPAQARPDKFSPSATMIARSIDALRSGLDNLRVKSHVDKGHVVKSYGDHRRVEVDKTDSTRPMASPQRVDLPKPNPAAALHGQGQARGQTSPVRPEACGDGTKDQKNQIFACDPFKEDLEQLLSLQIELTTDPLRIRVVKRPRLRRPGRRVATVATSLLESRYAAKGVPSPAARFKPGYSPKDAAAHRIYYIDIDDPRITPAAAALEASAAMGDVVDERGGYRGGGGGGGGYAGRKRRFREDDDVDRAYGDRGYNRGHDRGYQQRREPPSMRVRRQIVAIAENVGDLLSVVTNSQAVSRADEDVARIGKELADNYDDEVFRGIIVDLFPTFVLEQPLKIPFAAAMILHCNDHKPEFALQIIQKIAAAAQEAVQNTQLRNIKLLLRFLACLQPIFQGDGIFGLLDDLFSRAVDLQAASTEDTLGPELVKIIMLTLPYAMSAATADVTQQAAELLAKTEIVASAPLFAEEYTDPYARDGSGSPPAVHGLLDLLQQQLQNEANKGWPVALLPRLWSPRKAQEENLIDMDGAAPADQQQTVTHAFPAIQLPEVLAAPADPVFPELYHSVYADQDVETVPPTADLAASIVRDALVDTIDILDFNRLAVARALVEMDCYYAPGTFAPRATPFDKLRDATEGPRWKPEDLAVDAIFARLLTLPSPPHKPVYYHALITETCKIAPGAIAPSLGRAIRYLYRQLDSLDAELSHRFLDWFAQHLSNFDFRWKWAEWTEDVVEDNVHPRKAFIVAVLDKEIRLSFAKRIRKTLPEEYQQLVPASKDNDIPDYKFNDDEEVRPLIRLLRKRAPDEDVDAAMAAIEAKASQTDASDSAHIDSSDAAVAAVDALVTTLCYVGSKSLSHMLAHVERLKDRLTALAASPIGASQLVASVIAYWRNVQPGVAVAILDKLLNYAIITPQAVVQWVVAYNDASILAASWAWELTWQTVGKVAGRVRQICSLRLKPSVTVSEAESLEASLTADTEALHAMHAQLQQGLQALAASATDGGVGHWAGRWSTAFRRRLAVDDMYVSSARAAFPVPQPDVEPEELADTAANGANGTNGFANGHGLAEDNDVDLDTAD